jgi:hypothetical protein
VEFTAEHVLVPGAQHQHTSLQACLSCHSGSCERWACLAALSVCNIVSVADGDLVADVDFQAPNQPGKQLIQTAEGIMGFTTHKRHYNMSSMPASPCVGAVSLAPARA